MAAEMRIVIEESVRRHVSNDVLETVVMALERADFADACSIGGVSSNLIVQCPNTRHGVMLDTRNLSDETLRWLLKELEASVRE